MDFSQPFTQIDVPKPKYSFEVWQYNTSGQPCLIFDDLAAEPFLRWSIYAQRLLANDWLNYQQISPAKWRIGIVWDYNLSFPNALKYILCAINRSFHHDKITIQAPKDFMFLVQVHETVLRLDVEAIRGTTFTAILTILRERLLFPAELAMVYCCISPHDLNLYNHALSLTAERLRQHRTNVSREEYLYSLADPRITGCYAQRVSWDLMTAIERNTNIKAFKNSARHRKEAENKRSRESLPPVFEQAEEAKIVSRSDQGDDGTSKSSGIIEEDLEQRPITPSSDCGLWELQKYIYSPGSVCSEAWTI